MKLIRIAAAAVLAAPLGAAATTGYFAHGYGLKAKGMGGVAIALPQDASSAITNPANLGFAGSRVDLELEWFRPIRDAEFTGSVIPDGSYSASGRRNFLIPGASVSWAMRPELTLGLLVYGNGGMNTTFDRNPFAAFGGSHPGGVDYMQLFVAPTLAWKPNPNHAIGLSLNLAYHQFGAQGLEGLAAFSASTADVSNRGRDSSSGVGLRIGWTGKVSENVTLGAMLQPRTNMGKLDRYQGLFRNGGDLDIPATYGIGIAVKATPRLTVAGDIQRIDYAKVPAIGTTPDCLFACALGAANGPGFGWRNMTAYKLGIAYDWSSDLTLRAGFVTGRQPIPQQYTFLNAIFPAVMEDHVTLGATWKTGGREITVGYMHAFRKKVNGSGSMSAFGGGEANLRMYQNSLGVAIGWKY
jgi:long-chain fatty acid transport protein